MQSLLAGLLTLLPISKKICIHTHGKCTGAQSKKRLKQTSRSPLQMLFLFSKQLNMDSRETQHCCSAYLFAPDTDVETKIKPVAFKLSSCLQFPGNLVARHDQNKSPVHNAILQTVWQITMPGKAAE